VAGIVGPDGTARPGADSAAAGVEAAQPRLLRACRREPVDATPIWLMRQAGRYLPEYRALREQHAFLDMVKTPELACEVTLQPLRSIDLDAAIIFADILPPLESLGFELEFHEGRGPLIRNPLRRAADAGALVVPEDDEGWSFTLEAIRLARRELGGRVPLIGFSGAPFTLACYAIQGSGGGDFAVARQFMMNEPRAWHAFMDVLARLVGRYLAAQVAAGAQVLQLFDSWAGLLSPADYRESVLPYSRAALAAAGGSGVPLIHFATGSAGLLELMQEAGGDVIGVDWRVDLDSVRRRLGDDVALQGNLDPVALLAEPEALEARATAVLKAAAGRPGHIFNLGHGVLPQTSPDNVRRLVELVHEWPLGAEHGGVDV
jgi:uroporphyrinogen decarboxylase